MSPNTAHLVYSDEDSGVEGKHFYNSHLMTDTLAGFVHQFLANHVCTNSEHPEAIFYIFQMAWMWKVVYEDWNLISLTKDTQSRLKKMAFGEWDQQWIQYSIDINRAVGHTPDVSTIPGLMNMLSTWAIIEFATVFNTEHYVESPLPADFLKHVGVARKTARGLIRFLDCHYFIEYTDTEANDGSGDDEHIPTRSLVDLAQDFILDLASTLLTAVDRMEEGGYLSSLHASGEYWRWLGALRKKGLDVDLDDFPDNRSATIPEGLFPLTRRTLKKTLRRHFEYPIFDAKMAWAWSQMSGFSTGVWIGWPDSVRKGMKVVKRENPISHEEAVKYGTCTDNSLV